MAVRNKRERWTAEQEAFLRQHYANTLTQDLAEKMGRALASLRQKAAALGLHKSRDHVATLARERTSKPGHASQAYRFAKGEAPWNKGVPFQSGGRSAETRFKPGHRPHTWVPVGTFRVNKDGVLERKFSDNPGGPNRRWRSFAAQVWEATNGTVPQGHIVVFRPGMRTTEPEQVTLDRLECITRAENVRRNSIHSLPPELAELARLRGSLTRAINQRAGKSEPTHPTPETTS